jgi:hypothetical protein
VTNIGREAHIIATALAIAIESLSRLPETMRPESDIEEMEAILAGCGKYAEIARAEALRRLKVLAWNVRRD